MKLLELKILLLLVLLVISAVGCNRTESDTQVIRNTQKLGVPADYNGRKGLLEFARCTSLIALNSTSARQDTLPESISDLRDVDWRDWAPNGLKFLSSPQLFSRYNRVEFDRLVSVLPGGDLRSDYFQYHAKQDPALAYSVPKEWVGNMLVLADAGNGRTMVLANPNVQTSDGEWEIWLHDWKFGTYRFTSVGELITHLCLFNVKSISDTEYRFGKEFAPGTCASSLFKTGMALPAALIPD